MSEDLVCDDCGGTAVCKLCGGVNLFDTRAAPQWTRTPPTRPGFYWARPGAKWTAQPVNATEWGPGELVAWSPGCDSQTGLDYYDLWAGPIEAPPLPEE
jgi:hypothetical protein